MRIAGKSAGAIVAFFAGATIFLAPDSMIGGGESARVIPVDTALAEPDAEADAKAQETLDAAARAAFSKIDDIVTGSLPPDAAAAVAANPMTIRLPAIVEDDGSPAIGIAKAAHPRRAATPLDVETVGSIPPREVNDDAADDVTASVGAPAAPMPAPKVTKTTESVKAPAPARAARAYRRPHPAPSTPRFRDRGPVAKVFRIFVMGVGFLPSRF